MHFFRIYFICNKYRPVFDKPGLIYTVQLEVQATAHRAGQNQFFRKFVAFQRKHGNVIFFKVKDTLEFPIRYCIRSYPGNRKYLS